MSKHWDQRLCDGALIAFAIWTVLANATVLPGGTLDELIQRAGIALVLGTGLAWTWRKRSERGGPGPVPSGSSPSSSMRVGAALVAAGFAAVFVPGAHDAALWWSGIALLLGLAFIEGRRAGPQVEPAPGAESDSPARQIGLLALSLLAVVVSLVLHRFGADDAFYINLAVAAVDQPDMPLLARDTLHGLAQPYPVMPIYMLQSFELLTAAIARITGIEALTIAHLFMPSCAAFLVPLASARLMRHLAPRRWLACVAVVTLIYLFVGDGLRGYGNFGLVHLYHGKAIFRTCGVALIAAYAIEYARAPSRARWARLALAQIAALGLTSSALWIAPSVAGLAFLCGTPFSLRPSGLARLAGGLATSFYPIAAGLWLTTELEQAVTALGPRAEEARLFSIAFRDVLGHGPVAVLFAASMLGAWGAAPTSLARRFALVFPLGFLLLFWNPYLAPFLARTATGNATYWRVFWVLPLPCLVALTVTAPIDWLRSPRWPRFAGASLALGLASILYWGPTRYILSAENRTRLAWPTIKFPPGELATARAIVARTQPGDHVLAPADIGRWLPTLHGHPFPLLVRDAYLDAQLGLLGDREVLRRRALTGMAGGEEATNVAKKLGRAVEDYGLAAVCLSATVQPGPALIKAFEHQGLERVWSSKQFVLWARSPQPADTP